MRAAAVAVLLFARLAGAQGDYDVDNRAWNGLADFARLAAGVGITVEAKTEVDWQTLSPDRDAIAILYPTSRVEPVHLTAFLRAGGRLLIGDDFGNSDEALARLGLLRRTAQGVRARRYDQNPNLPIAFPRAQGHPLAREAPELITNHPSTFDAPSGADVVYTFGGQDAVVVAGDLGAGRWVAVSDPSVLINGMLAFDGNLAFALNVIRYLAPMGRPARIILLTQD